MPEIEYLETSKVYDNDRPHVRSRHGYFPGLTVLPSGELLALFVMAEAFEAANATTWLTRSSDGGRTWRLQGPLYDKNVVGYNTSDALKATTLRDGTLVAIGYRFRRDDAESPISSPETGGMLPGDNIVSFSKDEGRTWTIPQVLPKILPELLEISGPCIELHSGELVAVAGLCPLPDGSNPSGTRGVIIRSRDRGRTWDAPRTYFEHPSLPLTPYEPRVVEMQPGRLVAIVWAYDGTRGHHHDNQIVISHDAGDTWSQPIDTQAPGQASSLLYLGGDLLLSIHAQRERDLGVWVRLVDLSGDRWNVRAEQRIYGEFHGRQTASGQHASVMFRSLRFGQPSLLALPDGEFLATHWTVEDGQGRILTHRLRLRQ